MKAHTSNFKSSIKTFGRQIDSIITYNLDGIKVELGTEVLNSITPSFKTNILKSAMKQLDIDSNINIPVGTILNYKFGVLVDTTYEYLDFGNYIVYTSDYNADNNSYSIVCYDEMLYSMVDYTDLGITYPITIRDYIKAICTKLRITFANAEDTFANYNKTIPDELYLDSDGNSLGYTFRDVLDDLAEVTASTIIINNEDKLEIKYVTNTEDEINEEFLKDINVTFGKKYGPINSIVLSRSSESDNVYIQNEQSIAENGLCEIKIIDNQIMNFNDRSEYLTDILSRINGLEYYINDFTSTGICYYDICDKYNVKIGETTYDCLMLNDEIDVTQGLEEQIYTEEPETSETDYTKSDKTDRKINQTYFIVNKQNQTIESVVNQTINTENYDSVVNKVSRISQTVNEINSKITNIADITVSGESSYAEVSLSNVNESEPILIKIRPILENISYLYPNDSLYPSDTLYPKVRTLRFENTTTSEIIDYEIPDDLLYYDSETYDEFNLSYDGQTCTITKRCKYLENGSVEKLASESINSYDFPKIELKDGNYKVSLLSYTSGYIYVTLMAKNIYTTQFYTKVETNSLIDQTSSSIDLSVDKKLTNYSTKEETNEISTKLKLTATTISLTANDNGTSCGINIKLKNEDGTELDSKSANITLSGLVKFTDLSGENSTTIDGSNIKTGTISAARLDASVITTSNFSAQSINADNIKSGTLSIQNGSHYFKMGFSTKHPEVSGLNITGSGGIAMNSASISNCYNLGTQYISASGSDGIVKCNTVFRAENLQYKDDSGTYHEVVGLYRWYSTGKDTELITIRDINGTAHYLKFTDGVLSAYSK